MDALIQKILFLTGGTAVAFAAAYGLYTLWEEHTATGRCFSAERKLEQHRFGIDFQKAMSLADDAANRKRSVEICLTDDGVCLEGFARDLQEFCNAEITTR
ncbi:hypothetical protein NUH88_01545 [Nisaea acidiphila]|uniref:Uncharacterized protein n=1 Tax=Nisaea acidiphila TaxID=1862145 RepID=A0A9J7AV95_9PROT|nr:hypothetical protein [Nisaea acidiphila]UUX50385.1 hypothetical protein NUH88_01545 [Nisaea acidiphila]